MRSVSSALGFLSSKMGKSCGFKPLFESPGEGNFHGVPSIRRCDRIHEFPILVGGFAYLDGNGPEIRPSRIGRNGRLRPYSVHVRNPPDAIDSPLRNGCLGRLVLSLASAGTGGTAARNTINRQAAATPARAFDLVGRRHEHLRLRHPLCGAVRGTCFRSSIGLTTGVADQRLPIGQFSGSKRVPETLLAE